MRVRSSEGLVGAGRRWAGGGVSSKANSLRESTSRYLPRRTETAGPHTNLHTRVPSGVTHDSQNVPTSQRPPTEEWTKMSAHRVQCSSAIKRGDSLMQAATQVHPKNVFRRERSLP